MLKRIMLILLFLCLPLTGKATCSDIVNSIHSDIKHYSTFISHQNLPWKKLAWLEKNLGRGKMTQVENNQMKYSWECENGSYLSVRIDASGIMTKVSGQYSSDEGSGLFYTFLRPNPKL